MNHSLINRHLDELNFTAIDFETANEKRYSPCSMGIVVVRNGQIEHEQHILIRPKEIRFTEINTRIHGIDEGQVINAPEFNEVWQNIQHLIADNITLAHNADFDISVLQQTLDLYNLRLPSFRSMCTIKLAKEAFAGLENYRLADVAKYIGYNLEHHHALSDAKAAAMIGVKSIPFIDRSKYYYDHDELTYPFQRVSSSTKKGGFGYDKKHIQSDLLKPNLEGADANNPFYNKKVVFTGDLQSITRKEAAERIQAMGADINVTISKLTQIVVLGQKAGPKKLEKIEALKMDGIEIRIMEEAEFRGLIG